MMRITSLVLLLVVTALAGFEIFEWTVNRVYVPEGQSLQLRYKGPLIFTWLSKKAENGKFADESKGEVGVLERLRGPGRHFYCPIWWERKLVDDVLVHPGEIAVLNSMLGEEGGDRKDGQFLVAGDVGHTEHKGTLRHVLGPGRYRINPYAYQHTIYKAEVSDVGQLKHSGWVEIPAGYVGVQTYLTDDPVSKRHAGIQDDVLPPGLYAINPKERQIDLISIGYDAKEISTEKQKDENGRMVVDESGEGLPVPDTGISFPSSDGFKIHMDFSVVWGVMPDQCPDMIRRFGDLKAVEQKIILPQCESVCRNYGSRMGAVELLVGDSREKFQQDVDMAIQKVLKEKNLTLLYGLVPHIYIPKDVREPIQKGYIADELTLTREQETKTAKTEANLREAEQKVLLEAAKITEETKKLVANINATGQQTAEQMQADTARKVAAIDRKAAEIDAQRVVTLGEAQAQATKLQQQSKAELFGLAVKAFGEPAAYTQWEFAVGLPDNIDLKMIYAGNGTLWTDLKGIVPTLPVKDSK
jgi:regulator of protease activity HflC (stomatin/prohibitin superfamily)